MDIVDRALADLRALDARLRAHESEVHWTPEYEAFDPVEALDAPLHTHYY
jgi:hypothetical protein